MVAKVIRYAQWQLSWTP